MGEELTRLVVAFERELELGVAVRAAAGPAVFEVAGAGEAMGGVFLVLGVRAEPGEADRHSTSQGFGGRVHGVFAHVDHRLFTGGLPRGNVRTLQEDEACRALGAHSHCGLTMLLYALHSAQFEFELRIAACHPVFPLVLVFWLAAECVEAAACFVEFCLSFGVAEA